jgi:hypothetical protein
MSNDRERNKAMSSTFPQKHSKEFLKYILGAALAVTTLPSFLVAGDTPLKTVQEFKTALEANNLVTMCALMAESDGSEPLKRSNYVQMQQSLQGLVKLWQGLAFYYSEPIVDASSTPNRAFLKVRIERPSQEVKFTLLKFGANWYIFDIEIFFK